MALISPSGIGKGTVVALLLCFWDPVQGQVLIAGMPAPSLRLNDLRTRVAMVTQDTYVFNDTWQAIIRLTRRDADDAEVRVALEQSASTKFVEQVPKGLNTRVGEHGA